MESLATVERAIDLLFHLHSQPAPRGVTALGRALGVPKSSAHRLLTALTRRGLVERDSRGHYRPGVGLVALGLGVLEREPVVEAARPVLQEQAASLGETVFLTAARGGRIVVLDKVEGTGFLRAAPRVGQAVPVHATAVGKLHLALAPDTVAAGDAPYEAFTAHTAATATALEREVARARQRGFAESREEWIPGLAVVAAPVFVSERLAGALAVAGPAVRLDPARAEAVTAQLLAAARRVGARLSGTGS